VKNSIRHITSILLGGAALLCVVPAWAQTTTNNASSAPEEVIVTAEMHAGTVQDTAASIAAVTGDDLSDRGITSLADLA
jgi:outer membrane receptor for ferrienterochelin and colicin